jgi:hypothetical protein
MSTVSPLEDRLLNIWNKRAVLFFSSLLDTDRRIYLFKRNRPHVNSMFIKIYALLWYTHTFPRMTQVNHSGKRPLTFAEGEHVPISIKKSKNFNLFKNSVGDGYPNGTAEPLHYGLELLRPFSWGFHHYQPINVPTAGAQAFLYSCLYLVWVFYVFK